MQQDSRWAVSIEGEPADLEDARELFASGKTVQVHSIAIPSGQTPTVVLAAALETSPDAMEVRRRAKRIVDLINGVLFVRDGSRTPLTINAVHKKQADGSWDLGLKQYVMKAEVGRFRMKGHAANLLLSGTAAPPPPPPPAEQIWLDATDIDDSVADVLTYLRDDPDWFALYKAFETMKVPKAKKSSPKTEWPSDTELTRFTRSAQFDRHSDSWNQKHPFANPMNLDEGTIFLRNLVAEWLTWRAR